MMGDMDTEANMSDKRARKYFVGHKGPYIVNVRSVNKPLESKKIQKFVFDKYKHVHEVKQVNQHKLRIVFQEKSSDSNDVSTKVKQVAEVSGGNAEFSDLEMNDDEKKKCSSDDGQAGTSSAHMRSRSAREEANDFPLCTEWNTQYRVYIPEKLVEVRGVISLPVGHDIQDLMNFGCGRFRNALIKEVTLLEANRIKKKNETGILEDTNAVVVTFEGLVLPNVCDYGNLLIPVREYKYKQMFCKKCQNYNHTESMCNNKKMDLPAEIKCFQCKTADHESGSVSCPKRKVMEKKIQEKDRQKRKETYAEMLKILDPNDTMPNEIPENVSFPPLNLPSRKRSAAQRKPQAEKQQHTPTQSPQRKRPANEETVRESPPGFRNPVVEDEELVESIVNFIKSLIMDLDIPPVFKQLINNYFTPYLHKIIKNLTDSVMQKICGMSWQTTENV